MKPAPFTGVLVAGGNSSRMGFDKATIPWEGGFLWERQVRVLQQAGARDVFVSGKSNGPYRCWEEFSTISTLEPLTGLSLFITSRFTRQILESVKKE